MTGGRHSHGEGIREPWPLQVEPRSKRSARASSRHGATTSANVHRRLTHYSLGDHDNSMLRTCLRCGSRCTPPRIDAYTCTSLPWGLDRQAVALAWEASPQPSATSLRMIRRSTRSRRSSSPRRMTRRIPRIRDGRLFFSISSAERLLDHDWGKGVCIRDNDTIGVITGPVDRIVFLDITRSWPAGDRNRIDRTVRHMRRPWRRR